MKREAKILMYVTKKAIAMYHLLLHQCKTLLLRPVTFSTERYDQFMFSILCSAIQSGRTRKTVPVGVR